MEELLKFLSNLSADPQKIGGILPPFIPIGLGTDLQYFRRELDFVSVAVLSTLAVHNYTAESALSKKQDAISLSALLKASQRLSSMTDITGNICVTKGKFFILTERVKSEAGDLSREPESKSLNTQLLAAEEEEKEVAWKQEGLNAELVISLNMMLNTYVLQIYVQEKSGPSDSLHMGRKENQAKYSFYINYDLHFRYLNASELGSLNVSGSKLQDSPLFPEVAKTIKNFVFHWKYTIDPDADVIPV